MPDDPIRPPDLVGAGIAQPPQDPSSLMGLLRSQGSLPAEALALLGPTPNPVQAYASALAGGVAQMRGVPNPVAQQQTQQQSQQLQQAALFQRVQEQRQAAAAAKQKSLLTVYDSLLKSPNPDARVVGGRGVEQFLKSQGQPIPPGFADSFRHEELTLDKRNQAYFAILAAQSDPTLTSTLPQYLERELSIPPSRHAQLIQEAKSPAIHKALFGKTPEQEDFERRKAERDERRFELDIRKQDAREARDAAREVRDERRIALAERQADVADKRFQLSQAKFEWAQAKGPEEKRLKALDQAELLSNQLDATSAKLQAAGYLPDPGAGLLSASYLKAKGNRIGFPNEPDWQLWVRHLQPAMVGYARSVQNDIGPRAMAAFQGAIRLMEDPPDLKSIQEVVRNMRIAIRLGREGNDTATNLLIQHPDGSVERVPWQRGMIYAPGDHIVRIE